ncbi:hypothetical protein HYH03_003475 [Edaphochlamys debaryana]|uniref:Uncharacterized protein n=1 Tax=Edaphochlamys debaryana TaxID=47281 RepID=A0A835Y9E3_9CHLO|nr:hypothetical protein HYH03_003475 [Edaphochlamys debaryana]|eukprot:KAG2498735.1 hypothetical protein HYH03_003475 [Edaphochlamys debaryana]
MAPWWESEDAGAAFPTEFSGPSGEHQTNVVEHQGSQYVRKSSGAVYPSRVELVADVDRWHAQFPVLPAEVLATRPAGAGGGAISRPALWQRNAARLNQDPAAAAALAPLAALPPAATPFRTSLSIDLLGSVIAQETEPEALTAWDAAPCFPVSRGGLPTPANLIPLYSATQHQRRNDFLGALVLPSDDPEPGPSGSAGGGGPFLVASSSSGSSGAGTLVPLRRGLSAEQVVALWTAVAQPLAASWAAGGALALPDREQAVATALLVRDVLTSNWGKLPEGTLYRSLPYKQLHDKDFPAALLRTYLSCTLGPAAAAAAARRADVASSEGGAAFVAAAAAAAAATGSDGGDAGEGVTLAAARAALAAALNWRPSPDGPPPAQKLLLPPEPEPLKPTPPLPTAQPSPAATQEAEGAPQSSSAPAPASTKQAGRGAEDSGSESGSEGQPARESKARTAPSPRPGAGPPGPSPGPGARPGALRPLPRPPPDPVKLARMAWTPTKPKPSPLSRRSPRPIRFPDDVVILPVEHVVVDRWDLIGYDGSLDGGVPSPPRGFGRITAPSGGAAGGGGGAGSGEAAAADAAASPARDQDVGMDKAAAAAEMAAAAGAKDVLAGIREDQGAAAVAAAAAQTAVVATITQAAAGGGEGGAQRGDGASTSGAAAARGPGSVAGGSVAGGPSAAGFGSVAAGSVAGSVSGRGPTAAGYVAGSVAGSTAPSRRQPAVLLPGQTGAGASRDASEAGTGVSGATGAGGGASAAQPMPGVAALPPDLAKAFQSAAKKGRRHAHVSSVKVTAAQAAAMPGPGHPSGNTGGAASGAGTGGDAGVPPGVFGALHPSGGPAGAAAAGMHGLAATGPLGPGMGPPREEPYTIVIKPRYNYEADRQQSGYALPPKPSLISRCFGCLGSTGTVLSAKDEQSRINHYRNFVQHSVPYRPAALMQGPHGTWRVSNSSGGGAAAAAAGDWAAGVPRYSAGGEEKVAQAAAAVQAAAAAQAAAQTDAAAQAAVTAQAQAAVQAAVAAREAATQATVAAHAAAAAASAVRGRPAQPPLASGGGGVSAVGLQSEGGLIAGRALAHQEPQPDLGVGSGGFGAAVGVGKRISGGGESVAGSAAVGAGGARSEGRTGGGGGEEP